VLPDSRVLSCLEHWQRRAQASQARGHLGGLYSQLADGRADGAHCATLSRGARARWPSGGRGPPSDATVYVPLGLKTHASSAWLVGWHHVHSEGGGGTQQGRAEDDTRAWGCCKGRLPSHVEVHQP